MNMYLSKCLDLLTLVLVLLPEVSAECKLKVWKDSSLCLQHPHLLPLLTKHPNQHVPLYSPTHSTHIRGTSACPLDTFERIFRCPFLNRLHFHLSEKRCNNILNDLTQRKHLRLPDKKLSSLTHRSVMSTM